MGAGIAWGTAYQPNMAGIGAPSIRRCLWTGIRISRMSAPLLMS
jgi:hypothetical protein